MKRATLVRRSRAADWARLAGGLSLPVLVLSALGGRTGLVPDEALLAALSLGFLLGIGALALGAYALTDIWSSGADGAHSAIAGIVYASPALVVLGLIAAAAIFYPRLTDVTTDLADPPPLEAAGAERFYPDPHSVALQIEAYPDLAPHVYPQPLSTVYAAARKLIGERGWTLTYESHPGAVPEDAAPAVEAPQEEDEVTRALARKAVITQSRGEASAEAAAEAVRAPGAAELPSQQASFSAEAPTPVLGFSDDIAVRLRATSEGTQVDLRSASRIGEHDLGQNARRISRFLADLDAALQPNPDAPEVFVGGAPAESASPGQ